MVPAGVPIAIAAGIDDPDRPFGTDALQIQAAIESVSNPDLVAILERGVKLEVFRPFDFFQAAIDIMGACLFYFIGAGNIQQFPQGKRLFSKAMLEQHTQEAIELILAGVRRG